MWFADFERLWAIAMSGNAKALEAELTRMLVFSAAIDLVVLIVSLWVLYLVIKAAVRDGINESRMVERPRLPRRDTTPPIEANTEPADLPPMKAER